MVRRYVHSDYLNTIRFYTTYVRTYRLLKIPTLQLDSTQKYTMVQLYIRKKQTCQKGTIREEKWQMVPITSTEPSYQPIQSQIKLEVDGIKPCLICDQSSHVK